MLTTSSSYSNLVAWASALSELEARLRTSTESEGVAFPVSPELLEAANSWTVITNLGDLDLVLEPAGTRGYEDLIEQADELRVASDPPLSVWVASLADIIRSKRAAGRAKDVASLPLLRETLEEIDRPQRR